MWQRIQTLYLAVAAALVALLFFADFATIFAEGGEQESIRYTDKLSYLLLIIFGWTGNLIALLTFKNRPFQLRVTIVSALVLVGFSVVLGIDYFRFRTEMVHSVTILFPLLAAGLDFLASRKILSDEILVTASGRLRSADRKRRRREKAGR